jgi:hypothetical protein
MEKKANIPSKRKPNLKKSSILDVSSVKKGQYIRFDNIKNAFLVRQVKSNSILVSPMSSRSLEFVFFTEGQAAGILILKELENTLYSDSGINKDDFRITGIRRILKSKPKY